MLERFFHLSEHQTTGRTEILAGVTTFLTMAYIIVVQLRRADWPDSCAAPWLR